MPTSRFALLWNLYRRAILLLFLYGVKGSSPAYGALNKRSVVSPHLRAYHRDVKGAEITTLGDQGMIANFPLPQHNNPVRVAKLTSPYRNADYAA